MKFRQGAWNLEQINLNDSRLKRRLKAALVPLTAEMIRLLWLEVTQPDREAEERARIMREKARRKSDALRYFVITNSRGNTIHLLAEDGSVARWIAWVNGRIKDRQNGHIRAYDTVSIDKLPYGAALHEALIAGWPGEIEIMGTRIVHPERKMVFG